MYRVLIDIGINVGNFSLCKSFFRYCDRYYPRHFFVRKVEFRCFLCDTGLVRSNCCRAGSTGSPVCCNSITHFSGNRYAARINIRSICDSILI